MSTDGGMEGAMMSACSRHRSVRQGSRLKNRLAGQVSKATPRSKMAKGSENPDVI